MEEMEGNEGMSTGRKVAAGAALGVAVPAAVAVGKKLLGSDGDGGGRQQQQPQQRSSGGSSGGSSSSSRSRARTSSTAAKSKSSRTKRSTGSRRRSTRSRSGSSSGGSNRTKEQLYKQAKQLGIEGRSSMNKAQLERAIARKRA
ncbi:MAG TPA: hypothetical protein VKB73_13535 [Gaiellaceae bacterium]|nr:hypothetical protein [Gaiellaceae bacterium]